MCGIFGYVSTNPLSPEIVFTGLKNLEYRGYDSWGIAVKISNTKNQKSKIIQVEKHVGKIDKSKLYQSPITSHQSQLAIGHTRWATHGGVTVKNAHPHLDCTKTLALVHNGIFENYEEIKAKLIKRGHKFESETDTEAIVHLIEHHQRTQGFATAVRNTFNQMSGLNAFVVINSVSRELIAVKNGSPLIIGISPSSYFIASDISALPPMTTKVVLLKDYQMVILGEKIKIIDTKTGKEVKFKPEIFRNDNRLNSKGRFKHFLIKEIYDQPRMLENIAKSNDPNIDKLSKTIKNAYGTFMLGCGTASYAALAGTYLFSKIAKKHVNFAVGSEFEYLQDYIKKNSLIIPISQSGETIDVVEPVKNAKEKGATIVPVVNVATSTLARLGDYSLNINAGVEKAVVGTKSFTAMIAVLLLAAYSVSGDNKTGQRLLLNTSKDLKTILKSNNLLKIKKLSAKLSKKESIFTIGRGLSYIAALEGALKLKETALIHAEGFAGGELKHGVLALIEKKTPCIVFAPNDKTYPEIISNAQEIKARGGFIIGVGPKNNSVFDEFLRTEDLSEATLISQIVYMQLLAYFLALKRGIKDPDKPRNLAKSVTVK
jgi:glucosamine--fructose-6-phosphate aminotransferase (isomerizing)